MNRQSKCLLCLNRNGFYTATVVFVLVSSPVGYSLFVEITLHVRGYTWRQTRMSSNNRRKFVQGFSFEIGILVETF